MVSSKLRQEVFLARARGTRQYQLARLADLHPTTFSALINSMTPVRVGDPRVIRIGAVLGLRPDECFGELAEEDVHVK